MLHVDLYINSLLRPTGCLWRISISSNRFEFQVNNSCSMARSTYEFKTLCSTSGNGGSSQRIGFKQRDQRLTTTPCQVF